MTDPISLSPTLTNNLSQDGSLSLYRTRENALTLRLAGPAMQFVAGSTATATVIQIDWGGLLAPDELAAVKIVADGWESKLVDLSGTQVSELRPTRNLSLPAGTPQAFAITVPKVGSQPTSATIGIQYQNIGGADDDFLNTQMFVVAPPVDKDKAKPLPVSVGWATDEAPKVYVSPKKNDLIPNRLRFYISNEDAKALGAAGGSAEFLISFITIAQPAPGDPRPNPGLNALTYEAEARSIKMTPVGDGAATWKIIPPAPGKALVWTLQPQSKQILDPNASVEVLVESIRTVLPAFSTTLFVQSVVDIPGYQGRVQRLHFDKALPPPGILMFDADRREIAAGDAVELTWQVMALDELELSYQEDKRRVVKSHQNGDFNLNDRVKLKPKIMTVYTLTPYAGKDKLPAISVTISVAQPPPKINSFTADPPGPLLVDCDPKPVTLKWDVSGAYTLELRGPDGDETVTGQTSIVKNVDKTTTYTLRAANQDGDIAEKPVTVSICPPAITAFEANPPACDFDPGKPPMVAFSWTVSGAKELMFEGEVMPGTTRGISKPVLAAAEISLTARNNDGAVSRSVWVKTYRDFLIGRSFSLNNVVQGSRQFLGERIDFFHEDERNLDRVNWLFKTATSEDDSGFGGTWQIIKNSRGFVLAIALDLDRNMVVKLEYDPSVFPLGLTLIQLPSVANWQGSNNIHDVMTFPRQNKLFL